MIRRPTILSTHRSKPYGVELNDLFLFSRGDGADFIIDTSGEDVIGFTDIASTELRVRRVGDDLLLFIPDSDDLLTLHNQYNGSDSGVLTSSIEEVHFSDGVVWNFSDLMAQAVVGSDVDDAINGFDTDEAIDALDGADLVYAQAGADRVSGGAGKDTLYGGYGADQLSGDAGDDRLYGEQGEDLLSGVMARICFKVVTMTISSLVTPERTNFTVAVETTSYPAGWITTSSMVAAVMTGCTARWRYPAGLPDSFPEVGLTYADRGLLSNEMPRRVARWTGRCDRSSRIYFLITQSPPVIVDAGRLLQRLHQ